MSDDASGDRPADEALRVELLDLLQRHDALARELATVRAEHDALLRIAGHDLRAPIRGMLHLIAWLDEDLRSGGADPERVGTHLELLASRAQRLGRLVDGLIAYARVGRTDASSPTQATLATLANGALTRVAADPACARVTLMAGAGADRVLPHADKLEVVLGHLIHNAARHAATAGRDVTVRLTCEQVDGARVSIAVSDDGRGIDARHHARIWEPFSTLEPRDQSDTAGVGLAIVKRIVERSIGGEVSVTSEPGAGASFRFTWSVLPRIGRDETTADQPGAVTLEREP